MTKLGLLSVVIVLILTIFFSCSTRPVNADELVNGCSKATWISELTSEQSRCPRIDGYDIRPVFEQIKSRQENKLGAFCRIEKRSVDRPFPLGKLPEEIERLIEENIIRDNVNRSCSSIGAMAETPPDVTKILDKQFILQTDKDQIPPLPNQSRRARLTLIDTIPSQSSAPWNNVGQSPHGAALLDLARRLTCNSLFKDCTVTLSSEIGLAYSYDREKKNQIYDPLNGGFYGSQEDLAQAIVKAVNVWGDVQPESQLVINLSLGWNGLQWGGLESDTSAFNADVHSVYRAIEYASCHGALVIAAAGNKAGFASSSEGSLLPAAWQRFKAPTSQQCERSYGVVPPKEKGSNSQSQSLVYGSAGIDFKGQPLKNHRPKSLTQLMAFGDHAIVYKPNANQQNETLTGSSVSTIVTSSVAATLWSQRPDLSAHQLMDLLYDTGMDLEFTADVIDAGETPPLKARRLSFCQALQKACANGQCPAPAQCFWNQVQSNLNGTSLFSAPPVPFNSSNVCTVGSSGCITLASKDSFIQPWLIPQPDSNLCPNCSRSQTAAMMAVSATSTTGASSVYAEVFIIDGMNAYPIAVSGSGSFVLTGVDVRTLSEDAYILAVLIDGSQEIIPIQDVI